MQCNVEGCDREAQIQAFRMERYWMAGLRALTTEAAAEAAVAKLG